METETTVSSQLCKQHVKLTDIPLIKSHREPHKLHCEISHQRNPDNVKELLFRVRKDCEQRIWMLGQVVCSMVLPEPVCVVHQAMVPVVVEVEDDTV